MSDFSDIFISSTNNIVNSETSTVSDIKAEIIEVTKDSNCYKCKYNQSEFNAYGEKNTYEIGDIVYINIPNGDWNEQKNITNKVYAETEEKTSSVNPFENIVYQTVAKSGLSQYIIANDNYPSETSKKILENFSLADFLNEGYCDTIGIKFKTNTTDLIKYNIAKSTSNNLNNTFGIKIVIFDDEKSATLQYESGEMFGNIYGFTGDISHSACFYVGDLDINVNSKINIILYEKGDFGSYDLKNRRVDVLTYADSANKDGKIQIKDFDLVLGVDSTKHEKNEITMRYLAEDHLFYYAWPQDRNTKKINFSLLSTTNDITHDDVKLWYSLNDTSSWKCCINEGDWVDGWSMDPDNGLVIPKEMIKQSSIHLKWRASLTDLESETSRIKYIESEEVILYRYRVDDSDEQDDEKNALKLKYLYAEGVDLSTFDIRNDKPRDKDIIIINEDSLKYVGYDARLQSKTEAFLPHYCYIDWNPNEPMFKEDTFLAGATITWKVPAPSKSAHGYIGGQIFGDSQLHLEDTLFIKSIYQNLSTVFRSPEEGIEYCKGEDVMFSVDEDNIRWMEISHTFSNDFKYSNILKNKIYPYTNLDKTDENADKFYLSWHFRVKDHYIDSMTNNKIYCTIKKEGYTFSAEYDLQVVAENKQPCMVVFADTFEPICLEGERTYNDDLYGRNAKYTVKEKKYHLFAVINNSSTRSLKDSKLSSASDLDGSALVYQPSFEIMRDYLGDDFILKQGYYYSDTDKFSPLDDLTYTLHIKPKEINGQGVLVPTINPEYYSEDHENITVTKLSDGTVYFDYYKNEDKKPSECYAWVNIGTGAQLNNHFLRTTEYKFEEKTSTSAVKNKIKQHLSIWYDTEEGGEKIVFKEDFIFSDDIDSIKLTPPTGITVNKWYLKIYLSSDLRDENDNEIYPAPGLRNDIAHCSCYFLIGNPSNYIMTHNNLTLRVKSQSRGIITNIGIPSLSKRITSVDYSYNLIEGNNVIYINYINSVDIEEDVDKILSRSSFYLPFGNKTKWTSETREATYFDDYSGFYIQLHKVLKDKKWSYPTLNNNCEIVSLGEGVVLSKELSDIGIENPSMFISMYKDKYVLGESVPLVVIYKNNWSDEFNAWDGQKVKINQDTVFASAFAAGTKNTDGKFTGALLGSIGKIDAEGATNQNYGLYGYYKDERSFELNSDGTAKFGKDGNGQIIIDGNSGIIKSGNYSSGSKGMFIDLDDAIFEMINKKDNTTYQLKLDVSDECIKSADRYPLTIGKNGDAAFKVNWKGVMSCTDAIINNSTIKQIVSMTNSKGKEIINSDGKLFEGVLEVDGTEATAKLKVLKDLDMDGGNIIVDQYSKIGTSDHYLQFTTGSSAEFTGDMIFRGNTSFGNNGSLIGKTPTWNSINIPYNFGLNLSLTGYVELDDGSKKAVNFTWVRKAITCNFQSYTALTGTDISS